MRQPRKIGRGRLTVQLAGQGLAEQDMETSGEECPDSLSYWQKRERWEALGKRVATFRDEAKKLGVPIETLPGARAAIENLRHLGQQLDRRVR